MKQDVHAKRRQEAAKARWDHGRPQKSHGACVMLLRERCYLGKQRTVTNDFLLLSVEIQTTLVWYWHRNIVALKKFSC